MTGPLGDAWRPTADATGKTTDLPTVLGRTCPPAPITTARRLPKLPAVLAATDCREANHESISRPTLATKSTVVHANATARILTTTFVLSSTPSTTTSTRGTASSKSPFSPQQCIISVFIPFFSRLLLLEPPQILYRHLSHFFACWPDFAPAHSPPPQKISHFSQSCLRLFDHTIPLLANRSLKHKTRPITTTCLEPPSPVPCPPAASNNCRSDNPPPVNKSSSLSLEGDGAHHGVAPGGGGVETIVPVSEEFSQWP